MYEKGRAWIELNMENLRHNVRTFQSILPENCKLMPAVKANAYGHGAVLLTKELQKLGIRDYCVASAAEGMELRQAGIQGQILVLGYTHPRDLELLQEYRLIQTVVDAAYGEELNALAEGSAVCKKKLPAYEKGLPVHMGIDTGMHRLGESWDNLSGIQRLWNLKNLRITGVYSHLCTSDGVTEEDRSYVHLQERRFQEVVRSLRQDGKRFSTHLQGSYGILNSQELTGDYDYARAGISLYGVFSESSAKLQQKYDLRPVLSLKARVECVREVGPGEGAGYGLVWHATSRRKLAAVSIGYADGLSRALSNTGHALVRGRKVPIVGRVCMDQLLLDVTEAGDVQPGEEAVFIGKSRDLEIRAEELAAEAGTISNEILSRLGARLLRMPVR